MSQAEGPLPTSFSEWLARHTRAAVVVSIAVFAAAALYAMLKTGGAAMMAGMMAPSSVTEVVLLFIMWWTMMMAMMLPSAAPAILIYAAMARKHQGKGVAPVAVFASGYAAMWTAFSLAAVILQITARPFIELNMTMAVTSRVVGGLLLLAAGLYQMTPLKQACLRKCQSPLMFFARRWRNGLSGAFRMGTEHGRYCLGCCWVLMALLFYGGVMDLRWIVGLAIYIAAEKLIPAGSSIAQGTGLILMATGAYVLWGAVA